MSVEKVRLQVLICTYGIEGIRRVIRGRHPRVDGVEYIVSWQHDDVGSAIPAELDRPDFRVYIHTDKGLGRNRNHSLQHSTAPMLLLSDDDLDYTREGLEGVLSAFEKYPDADVLTFRYATEDVRKLYPSGDCRLDKVPKGYYPVSFEIAFRREGVAGRHRFNPHFGVGSDGFSSGEEDLFYHGLLRSGLSGMYVSHEVCFHSGPTSAWRKPPAELTSNKGAVFLGLHPATWPLYMISHALREPRGRRIRYCRWWMTGVLRAFRLNVYGRKRTLS